MTFKIVKTLGILTVFLAFTNDCKAVYPTKRQTPNGQPATMQPVPVEALTRAMPGGPEMYDKGLSTQNPDFVAVPTQKAFEVAAARIDNLEQRVGDLEAKTAPSDVGAPMLAPVGQPTRTRGGAVGR